MLWGNNLAHEFYHLWIGGRIRGSDTDDHEWFDEGFTDYYADLALVQSDLMTDQQFHRKAEKVIGRYVYAKFSSLFPAQSLAEASANKGRYRFAVYDGGWVAAFCLDTSILATSHGARSLDDVMRLLYHRFAIRDRAFTLEELEQVMSEAAVMDLQEFFARYVYGRETMPVEQCLRSVGLDGHFQPYAGELWLTDSADAGEDTRRLRSWILDGRERAVERTGRGGGRAWNTPAMPNVVFAAPYPAEATMRFALAAAAEEGVRFGLISQQALEQTPERLRRVVAGHWRVDNALDPLQLEAGVRGLGGQLGSVDRLIGVLEHLQVPLAEVRDRLGIPGMGAEVAQNFRDKARMKTVLRNAGIPCARHCLAESREEAIGFARKVDAPLVVKPPAGAGAKATFRVDSEKRLREILAFTHPSAATPVLLEEHLTGRERSFETVMVDGRPVWHSISHYLPTPLEVLQNPWIQWCVILPREISGAEYDAIREIGVAALRALGLETGLSHMEWFELPGGRIAVSEVGARPPGAQITAMTSLAHDFDLYRAWARLMIYECFEPPERKYAAGAAFLRAQGEGRRVAQIRGLEQAQRELGDLVVEARLPRPGQPRGDSYEGEGWVLLRHPETEVLQKALFLLLNILRVEAGE